MGRFDRVVIRDRTEHQGNIHLAVHPFKCDGLRRIENPGDYMDIRKGPLPDYLASLADALWDGIPGLTRLFFSNGQITLQHTGVFDDKEIVAAARELLEPILETNLALDSVYADVVMPDA